MRWFALIVAIYGKYSSINGSNPLIFGHQLIVRGSKQCVIMVLEEN